jgi:hypothetical protein
MKEVEELVINFSKSAQLWEHKPGLRPRVSSHKNNIGLKQIILGATNARVVMLPLARMT